MSVVSVTNMRYDPNLVLNICELLVSDRVEDRMAENMLETES